MRNANPVMKRNVEFALRKIIEWRAEEQTSGSENTFTVYKGINVKRKVDELGGDINIYQMVNHLLAFLKEKEVYETYGEEDIPSLAEEFVMWNRECINKKALARTKEIKS